MFAWGGGGSFEALYPGGGGAGEGAPVTAHFLKWQSETSPHFKIGPQSGPKETKIEKNCSAI